MSVCYTIIPIHFKRERKKEREMKKTWYNFKKSK